LLIVADDLGWSDLGAFGGEIDTPHLDRLALRGVRLTNFHTAPVCAPTRAMLLTGADHHEVGLGVMGETITPRHAGKPGHEGHLNDRAALIAARMRDAGYRTLMAGKWHLGKQPEHSPLAHGFERSFALLGGEHNHYGADQTEATGGTHGPSKYRLDGELARYPEGAYSSEYFADRLIEFLDGGASDPRPFFAYLAFTAPHSPLQAPPALIEKYRGQYDAGPDALRESRLARMRSLELPIAHARPAPLRGGKPWSEMAADERSPESRRMEVYAAMVEAMDIAVGRVIAAIERMRKLDDTVVIFLSDNGPAGMPRETTSPWRELIAARADNRLENIGRASSYASMGPRWAEAQAAPFSLFKRFTTEGGVRTCSFVAGPGTAFGKASDAFVHVMDYAATILAIGGAAAISVAGKAPMRGRSMLGLLRGDQARVHPPTHVHCWEYLYGFGARHGDWKAVLIPPIARVLWPDLPVNQWHLYNVADDPGETTDLAGAQPAKLRELVAHWEAYAREVGVIVPEGYRWRGTD
jgi:arylsulfatase